MKQNTSNRRPALLALLSITFATCSALAQKPESPSPTVDIEKSDPFLKSKNDAAAASSTETSVEMLNAQAQVLFTRGETEKAIRLQNEAVAKAEKTLAKSLENLAKYQGRPGINEPIARKLREIVFPNIDFADIPLEVAVHFLQGRSRELDPEKKGVNILVAPLREVPTSDSSAEEISDEKTKGPLVKELFLKDVPLGEVLKHVCEATGTRFEIDGQVVKIVRDAP